ncbi:MAG: hypothetical protein ABSH45_13320, partial [Bryobacteraceae bacterium]
LERLADSQTSWNLIHYAPIRFPRQPVSILFRTLFLKIYLACFQTLSNNIRGGRVDKTKLCCPVLAVVVLKSTKRDLWRRLQP